MTTPETDTLIEAICGLADEIARLCPDCADRAKQLAAMVVQLRSAALDRSAVEDAIVSGTIGSDLSDAQISSTAGAVLKAAREDDGL